MKHITENDNYQIHNEQIKTIKKKQVENKMTTHNKAVTNVHSASLLDYLRPVMSIISQI